MTIPSEEQVADAPELSDTKLLAIFNELKSSSEPLAYRHRAQAFLNENMVNGNQFVGFDTRNDKYYIQTLKLADVPQKAKPLLANLALTWTSLLTKERPSVYAVGQGNSIQDKSAAEIATKLIEFLEQDLEIDDVISKTVYTGCYAGTAAIKVVLADTGAPKGELSWEPISVHEYLLDPGVQRPEDSRWIIFKKFIPEADAEDIFKANGLLGSPAIEKYHDGHDQAREGVADYELWMRPNRKYPTGFFAHILGEHVVEYIPEYPYTFIYPHDQSTQSPLPVVFFACKTVRGSPYGRTFITDAVPLQTAENEILSRLFKLWRQTSNVHKVIPKSLQDSIDEENSIIFFDSPADAQAIGYTQPPPISPLFGQLLDLFETGIYDVAGVSKTTTGQQDSASQSGKAIKFQAELDAQKTQDSIKSLQSMISQLYDLLLKLVQKFWTQPKLLNVFDDHTKTAASIQFSASDISGIDIRLQPRSGRDILQSSKQALEAEQQVTPANSLIGSIGTLIARQRSEELIETYLTTGAVDITPGSVDMEVLIKTIEDRQRDSILSADLVEHQKLDQLKMGIVAEL